MNEKKKWWGRIDGGKPTVTRVTHLLVRVFVWCSFRKRRAGRPPPWGSAGSQVERGAMGGEFSPRSLTVLTAAHWSDVASSLKRDTPPAVQAGVWGCRAEWGLISVCVWLCVCVPDTQTKRYVRRRKGRRRGRRGDVQVSLSFVIPSDSLSIIHVCEARLIILYMPAWENSPPRNLCVQQLRHQTEDRCRRPVYILPIHMQMIL